MYDVQGLLRSFCFPADSDKAPSTSNIQKNWADAAAALLGPVAPRQQLNSAFSDALASRAGAFSLAIAVDPGPALCRTTFTLTCNAGRTSTASHCNRGRLSRKSATLFKLRYSNQAAFCQSKPAQEVLPTLSW